MKNLFVATLLAGSALSLIGMASANEQTAAGDAVPAQEMSAGEVIVEGITKNMDGTSTSCRDDDDKDEKDDDDDDDYEKDHDDGDKDDDGRDDDKDEYDANGCEVEDDDDDKSSKYKSS